MLFQNWLFGNFPKKLGKILLLNLLCFGLFNCGAGSSVETQIEDKGDLIAEYQESDRAQYDKIRKVLEKTGTFDALIADVNENLALPYDISVIFTTCNEANAFYDLENIEITICYELIQEFLRIFEEDIKTEEDYANEVYHAISFTFFHELGHAVIDLYEFPVTGNEEDAADNFASIMLLDFYADENGVISGLLQFEQEAIEEQEDLENLAYWDEHSLSSQRFYNTACLIYGSDPNGYAFIVEDEYLPEERAELCEDEYEQKSNTWWNLLYPYLK